MFSKQSELKKNPEILKSFDNFVREILNFVSNLWLFWVLRHSLEFKSAWDKFFNSWKDFRQFPEKFWMFERKRKLYILGKCYELLFKKRLLPKRWSSFSVRWRRQICRSFEFCMLAVLNWRDDAIHVCRAVVQPYI